MKILKLYGWLLQMTRERFSMRHTFTLFVCNLRLTQRLYESSEFLKNSPIQFKSYTYNICIINNPVFCSNFGEIIKKLVYKMNVSHHILLKTVTENKIFKKLCSHSVHIHSSRMQQ